MPAGETKKQARTDHFTLCRHVYTHTMISTPEHQSCPATVSGWRFLFTASDTRLECTAELLATTHSDTVWFYEAEHADLTAHLT